MSTNMEKYLWLGLSRQNTNENKGLDSLEMALNEF
jgi:hypothetical protein